MGKCCDRIKKCISSYPNEFWAIALFSLVIGLIGLKWGAPQFWHPDEFIRIILRMGQNMSPNPHYFNNPALPMYLGAVMIVPYYAYLMLFQAGMLASMAALPYSMGSLSLVSGEFLTTVIVLTRLASVIASLITLFVVYRLCERAFGKKTAILSSLLLSLSPVFISQAKLATVDIYVLLFFWLTLLFEQRYLESGKQRELLFAAVCLGLTMASKYTGIFGALFLFVVLLLKVPPRSFVAIKAVLILLIKAGLVSAVVFLAVNPYFILAFDEFAGHIEEENPFFPWSSSGVWKVAWHSSPKATRGWFTYPVKAFSWMTPPVFLLSVAGLIAVGRALWLHRRKLDTESLLRLHLFLWVLLYYGLFIGLWTTCTQRFFLPLLPGLIIFAAYPLGKLFEGGQRQLLAGRMVTVLLIVFLLLITWATVSQFSNDTRYRAAEWLGDSTNMMPGKMIGFFSQQKVYLPAFPPWTDVLYIPFIHDMGLKEEKLSQQFQALSDTGPEYLVLTEDYYIRFYSGEGETSRTRFYDELLNGEHPIYGPVAVFERDDMFGCAPPIEFVSPTIVILKRIG